MSRPALDEGDGQALLSRDERRSLERRLSLHETERTAGPAANYEEEDREDDFD